MIYNIVFLLSLWALITITTMDAIVVLKRVRIVRMTILLLMGIMMACLIFIIPGRL